MDVEILLATHNGGRYLQAQLDSLTGQSYRHWRVRVRDDASQDNTRDIISRFEQANPAHVAGVYQANPHCGAKNNFGQLLEVADGDYFLFADQDDVWLPYKIEHLLARAKALELQYPGKPILVHSDLMVANADLKPLAASFWQYQSLKPQSGAHFKRLLIENCVTGCACLFNRRLLELARPLPIEAIMHDWWLALVASAFGVIDSLPETTLLYRQHAHNNVGARPVNLSRLRRLVTKHGWEEMHTSLQRKRDQATAFSARYSGMLDYTTLRLLNDFLTLPRLPWGYRQVRAWQDGFRMSTSARSIGLYMSL